LLDRLVERVALDKEEGDVAYFYALTFQLEYLVKLVTAGVVACIGDDADRSRYSLEHKLVRADSVGDWVDALVSALTGPPAQYFVPEATSITRELTERVTDGWRYDAVRRLSEAAGVFGAEQQLGVKVALRQFFEVAAALRNRSRGHGAPTITECSRACPALAEALRLVTDHMHLFHRDWAYLHRNLSGKYRVSPLLGACTSLDYLKRTRDVQLPDGVYVHVGRPVRVSLVFSDPNLEDIFLPNGNFKSTTFEVLSYITDTTESKDGTAWSEPPGRLQRSVTEGGALLDQVGNTFGNVPPMPVGHVPRLSLESRVEEELLKADRHPIISLTGPGGIGKTTIAIAAIRALCEAAHPPYEVILWLSARDIDLLESGPKPVSPRVVRKSDIARAAVELLEPEGRHAAGFSALEYFERCLTHGAAGPTLFVFDNFETVDSPADVFAWIDAHIRSPNKVLITTRFRDFAGDYPIEIGGMSDEEALRLIDQECQRLGVGPHIVTSDYKEQLIAESEGHPYVIKILLGQVAREGRAVKPERIMASADQLLRALFERTYESLSPAAQRVFLLLCSWRVFVPAVAVEAVSLRPGNERFDVSGALDELRRFSLIEEVVAEADGERFVGVPLAAAMYGKQKLNVSRFKSAVEEDRKLLLEFGAGKREDAHRGVLPRIERLVGAVAAKASENPGSLEEFVPILEYLGDQVPRAYLRLADLVLEAGTRVDASERAKRYVQRFLESARVEEKGEAWLRLADLCRATGDTVGEIHALTEAALLPTAGASDVSNLANRINNRVRSLKERQGEQAWSLEVKTLIERVAQAMERRSAELSATDYSRLAWLYLNIGREDRAALLVQRGLALDPHNEHLCRLADRLSV
jgi:tetratricopeptide (TPR) repeat protein